MSFLTPLFLVGLAGLAIPVLLHLIQKERKNVVQFPSLMFLRRIPYQSVRRRRIRNWLLLCLRLAALALIVMAFARPFLRRTEIPASASGAREVVILLDRSYSMGYGGKWPQAIAAAQNVINGLTPARSRVGGPLQLQHRSGAAFRIGSRAGCVLPWIRFSRAPAQRATARR